MVMAIEDRMWKVVAFIVLVFGYLATSTNNYDAGDCVQHERMYAHKNSRCVVVT